ncbi:hypothetical protein C4561_01840 [candidate division WWE3 bacterium]|uniref:dATP/dGTP diphosphohydrolase N-terminal domain-containing protein n=1 Tax=candidate division WWE3 bacterium TaxID=2053526 RepID=A0A3A4ZET1_UNCKA|nr:MAG: hypothetical protein C4561_01840 [candidate division WWE3 bacterium]
MSADATKESEGKLRFDLIPSFVLFEEVEVWTHGANKYTKLSGQEGSWNWEKGRPHSEYFAALCRHLFKYWAGEDIDPETGLNHLAQVRVNAAILRELQRVHPELDDRPKHRKWMGEITKSI